MANDRRSSTFQSRARTAENAQRWSVRLFALVLWCFGGFASGAERPNIVFIFSDDHALRTIGAYGSGLNETPNIDRIAREGALFTRSYCTNSICCPSRATILTGKHSHKNGVTRNGSPWSGDQFVFTRALSAADD